MPRRRTEQVLESVNLMNTAQIFRESIRVLLLHPTHFQSISFFLFSPLPLSLFISHFLIHQFPQLPSSAITVTNHLLGHSLPKLLSNTVVHIIICFPSTITFALLGRAAAVQAVSDSYNGIHLDGRRLFMRSGLAWLKLIHTSFWEFLIVNALFGVLVVSLAVVPKILSVCGICNSEILGFWAVLGFVGVPFCVAFAHVMVVGDLAKVISVLEECYGLDSFFKAKSLMEGRRQTALIMALFSNMGFRLVECVFEFRLCKGIRLWEGPLLVSMYSFVLVIDTVVNAVFYHACKL